MSAVKLDRSPEDSSSESKSDGTNDLDQESVEVISKHVENSWNIADDGAAMKIKRKWFKSEGPESYPKKALYFSVD